jgi:hypothetical protein
MFNGPCADDYSYQILKMCKYIYDRYPDQFAHIKERKLSLHCDDILEVYSFCLDAVVSDVEPGYMEEWENEILVIRDSRIREYFHAAHHYAVKYGIGEPAADYMAAGLDMMDKCLDISYSVGYCLNKKKSTGIYSTLIVEMTQDFFSFADLVKGIDELMEFYRQKAEEIHQLLDCALELEVAA